MTVGYLEALAGIAVSLSILMAIAWMVQQGTGNSGWVDTIWTFSVGLTGAGSALWPLADSAPNRRQWLVATLVAIWSLRLGVRIARRTAGMTEDPRYAAFARAWGLVTGIPPLEEQMLRSRGEPYRDYQPRTSAFFPLPPQKGMVT
jgi:steroid 5-alpha reductase family enzyme